VDNFFGSIFCGCSFGFITRCCVSKNHDFFAVFWVFLFYKICPYLLDVYGFILYNRNDIFQYFKIYLPFMDNIEGIMYKGWKRRCIDYENDISAKQKKEKKGSWFQG